MNTKKWIALGAILLSGSAASAITITTPVLNANVSGNLIQVFGNCKLGYPVQVIATDVSKVSTAITWTPCQGDGFFATPFDISAMKQGAMTIKAYQVLKRSTSSTTVKVNRLVAAATPTPTPVATPVATATPKPTATPAPTATPVASSKITLGVGGHEGLPAYPIASMEARFKFLDDNNLRIYRTGEVQIDNLDYATFDKMVALAKKYNITLRPGLLKADQATAYAVAKRYANDIKVWEVGNELNLDPANAAANIKKMVTTYKGIKQASDELGANLQTTITVTACNTLNVSGTCYNVKEGDIWFLDQAKAAGFNFNYVGFHLYPYYGDKGFWFDMYLSQMKAMSTKYNAKVLFNELNCGEIYQGNTDGGGNCPLSLNDILTELNTKYKDIVQEINIYELMDEPTHPVTWEQHFGVLYDINTPKKSIDVIRSFAK